MWFVDDINLGASNEFQDPTNRLEDRASAYSMEVSNAKNKMMVSSTENITDDITMNRQKLEQVDAFKYLSSTLN